MKTDIALSEALNIENEVEIIAPVKSEVVEETLTDDTIDDYNLSRKTFRDLINKGNSAIEGITDLARESESPRAYEVLATLMKTVSETTKDLYDLQKKTKELKENKNRPQDDQRINVEKAVFVGSTAELLKRVKSNENV